MKALLLLHYIHLIFCILLSFYMINTCIVFRIIIHRYFLFFLLFNLPILFWLIFITNITKDFVRFFFSILITQNYLKRSFIIIILRLRYFITIIFFLFKAILLKIEHFLGFLNLQTSVRRTSSIFNLKWKVINFLRTFAVGILKFLVRQWLLRKNRNIC